MDLPHGFLCTAIPLSPVIGWMAYGTFAPASNFWGRVYSRAAKVAAPLVSLTFDDGPTPGATERILDLLDELEVKATFFVIGQNVVRWPEIVRRMDGSGHLIANHSFDHLHLGIFRGPIYWNDQLRRTDDAIADIIGKRPAIFRPPMGHTTFAIHRAARRNGHQIITWNRRGVDGTRGETGTILRRLLIPTRPGDILMLHDGVDPSLRRPIDPNRPATIDAIRPLVQGLQNRDITFQPLDQLLGITAYRSMEIV